MVTYRAAAVTTTAASTISAVWLAPQASPRRPVVQRALRRRGWEVVGVLPTRGDGGPGGWLADVVPLVVGGARKVRRTRLGVTELETLALRAAAPPPASPGPSF